MTPRAFRDLPNGDQIEMMAHRREVQLRKSHAESVSRTVGKMEDPTDPSTKKKGRGR